MTAINNMRERLDKIEAAVAAILKAVSTTKEVPSTVVQITIYTKWKLQKVNN